jgi:hypothetical protein
MDRNMDDETQEEIMGDRESETLHTSPLQTPEHPALPGAHDVIRRLNRDTTWVATGLLGAVIFAALVLALLECHPKADDLAKEARQTTGSLLLNANPATPGNVMGSDRKSLSEITSGQATSVDHGLNPEINHSDVQANATSWSPAHGPDSAQVIRPKIPKVRRYVDVKTRLIALWHQSLQREKSRAWTLFLNSNKWQRKNQLHRQNEPLMRL